MIRKILAGVILPAAICFALASCSVKNNTGGKLFILGGGTIQSPVINKIIEISGIDQGGYGVILPMSSSVPDTAIIETSKYFTSKGLHNIYGINFKMGQACTQAILDSIKNARLVYISGGDQAVFMKIIEGTPIKEAIHESFNRGHLIAGTSAGASLMSKTMVTGNELKHPGPVVYFNTMESDNVETIEGLGMLEKVIIDQHFIVRRRLNRSVCMAIEHPDHMVIGIDEPAAILVEGNRATVYGDSQVVVIQHPEQTKKTNGLLGARNIRMDVYLPGESFEIKK